MLSGIALVVVLYMAIHLTAQGVLGTRLPDSPAPLADAAGVAMPAGRHLMLGGMVFSMLGLLGGNLLGCSRILYAFGRDGFLPRALAGLHPTTRIPSVAVLVHAGITMVFAATRTFAKLAILASVTIAVLYGMVCGAAFLLAKRAPEGTHPGVPLALQRLVAVLGIVAMLWLAAQSSWQELGSVAGTLLVAAVVFLVGRRARATGAPAEQV
jgi:amino acid transporter